MRVGRVEVEAKRSRTSLQILSIAVCLSDKTESRAGRAHRYRMKCLLHSQPLFMPMPRFDHLANSVVARQARQTEAFRATPDATFHYSLFIYLRLLGPLFLLHVSPYLRISLFIPFSRSLPLFSLSSFFLLRYLYFVVLLLSLLLAIMYLAPSTRTTILPFPRFLIEKTKTFANTASIRGNHEEPARRVFLYRNLALVGQNVRKVF